MNYVVNATNTAVCKAWVGVGGRMQATNLGTGGQFSTVVELWRKYSSALLWLSAANNLTRQTNNTELFVCSICTNLFEISECYGQDGVRNMTIYPYVRISTCGQTSARDECESLLANETQTIVVPCDYTPWDSSAGVFSACLLCICCAINLGFAAVVFRYRGAKAIRFAQFPLLLGFVLGACLVCLFGLVFIGPATVASCQLRTWLFNVSATICICPLFLKAYRVWRIFENPKLKHLVITNMMLFKLVCAVLLLEIVWLAVWTGVAPTTRTCQPAYFPTLLTPIPSYVCANDHSVFAILAAILIGLYVLSCVVLAILTVNVSSVFAEKEILFTSVNIFIVGGIVAYLFFFLSLGQGAKTSLVAVGLAWCSTFSVCVLVGPKLYLVFRMGEDYTDALAFSKITMKNTTDMINALRGDLVRVNQELVSMGSDNIDLRKLLNLSFDPNYVSSLSVGGDLSPPDANGARTSSRNAAALNMSATDLLLAQPAPETSVSNLTGGSVVGAVTRASGGGTHVVQVGSELAEV
jgi:hypothetical protein